MMYRNREMAALPKKPRFDFQHPQGTLQPPTIPAPGYPLLLASTATHEHDAQTNMWAFPYT